MISLMSLAQKYGREQPKDADVDGARDVKRSIRSKKTLYEPKLDNEGKERRSSNSSENNFASRGLMGNLPAHLYQDASLFNDSAEADLTEPPVKDIREYKFFGDQLSVLDDKVDQHLEQCAEQNISREKEKLRAKEGRGQAGGRGGQKDRRSSLLSSKTASGPSAKEKATGMGRRGSVLSKSLVKKQSIYEKTCQDMQELGDNSSPTDSRRYSRRASNGPNKANSFEKEMLVTLSAQKAFDRCKLAICKQGNLSVTNDFEIEAVTSSKVQDARNFGKIRYTIFAIPDSRQKVKVDIIEIGKDQFVLEKIIVRGGR